jgi:hypothetical protein
MAKRKKGKKLHESMAIKGENKSSNPNQPLTNSAKATPF